MRRISAMVIVWIAVPLTVTSTLCAWYVWVWRNRSSGCCPPPVSGRLWVCGHRKAWRKARNGGWYRLSKRRYVRLAMTELGREIQKVTSDGR